MEAQMSNGPRRSGYNQAIKVYQYLKDNLTIYPDSNMCDYKHNQTDTAVADQLMVSISTVSKVRRENFGDLKAAHDKKVKKAATEARITTLEQSVAAIARELLAMAELMSLGGIATDEYRENLKKQLNNV
jgi:hypothetical protein